MADDNKKTAAARGKQSVSRARKSASLNVSSQVVGQRARGLRRNALPRAFPWARIA